MCPGRIESLTEWTVSVIGWHLSLRSVPRTTRFRLCERRRTRSRRGRCGGDRRHPLPAHSGCWCSWPVHNPRRSKPERGARCRCASPNCSPSTRCVPGLSARLSPVAAPVLAVTNVVIVLEPTSPGLGVLDVNEFLTGSDGACSGQQAAERFATGHTTGGNPGHCIDPCWGHLRSLLTALASPSVSLPHVL